MTRKFNRKKESLGDYISSIFHFIEVFRETGKLFSELETTQELVRRCRFRLVQKIIYGKSNNTPGFQFATARALETMDRLKVLTTKAGDARKNYLGRSASPEIISVDITIYKDYVH